MNKFDQIYQDILKQIMQDGVRELNERTGLETASIPGLTFQHDIEKDGFPLLTLRTIPVKLFIAEQVWFLSGARKPEDFLRDYTKIWDIFTNPGDVVTVAYGYRWRKHFGRDQIAALVTLLEKEPSSRHGVVVTWDPSSDGLGGIAKKNVPCPYTFTVNIIGGRLHMHNIVRSNDMILGAPADIAGFALLQMILAQRLGVRPGIYTHTVSNAHIYSNHYEGAEEMMRREVCHPRIDVELPERAFERSEEKDKTLVDALIEQILGKYNPQPAITGLKIAL
jgi:thymidylate synthase